MYQMLLGPITSLVTDVIKRVLPPEKMSEEERRKLEVEASLEVQKLMMDKYKLELEDIVSARKLAEAELSRGSAFTNILAALHRPLWSIVTLLLFSWSLLSTQLGLPEIHLTELHKDIMQTVIVFYFSGRSVEKVVSKSRGK